MAAFDGLHLHRLRRPEAEVWVRLRPPTLLQAVGRELMENPGADGDYPADLMEMVDWMLDTNAAANCDWTSDDLREAGKQLVEMVAPVLDDRPEVARRVKIWAEEWSFS